MTKVVVIGAINWDINLFVKRFPKVDEEVAVKQITRVPGGTAANVSVAASRLLNPNDVAFIGCLGKDSIGKEQVKILKKEGVNTTGIKLVDGVESGQAYITIDEAGRNCIHTYFGANTHLSPEDLTENPRLQLIKETSVIVIMDPPFGTAERMAKIGRSDKKIVIWNPGVYWEIGLKVLGETLKNTDYFILSSIEFENLLGTSVPREVGLTLYKINKKLCTIIKQGSEGCTLVKSGGEYAFHIPAIPLEELQMKVINTVGCGDALVGTFAAFKSQGYSDEEALKRANCAGAFKATKEETRGSPTREELEFLLEKVERLRLKTGREE